MKGGTVKYLWIPASFIIITFFRIESTQSIFIPSTLFGTIQKLFHTRRGEVRLMKKLHRGRV